MEKVHQLFNKNLIYNYSNRLRAFLEKFPDDKVYHRKSLEKLQDNDFINLLLNYGILKEELTDFFYYDAKSYLPYSIIKTYNTYQEKFNPFFSIFKPPIFNVIPEPEPVNLLHIYKYIKSSRAKKETLTLRQIEKRPDLKNNCPNKKYKWNNFYYACFSAILNKRSAEGVRKKSKILCLDYDHVEGLERFRDSINNDKHTLMSFISPNGDGLKVIFRIDTDFPQQYYYQEISDYICEEYSLPPISIDKGAHDIARATFLPHDPQIYLDPSFLN